jgi:LmbE family N-acetylglucosaminyl deacetylase
MIRFAPFALAATLLAATAPAQSTPFTDPANLRGERPTPRDGRELPLDVPPPNATPAQTTLALRQILRKLSTRASILNIVAHPDDEDGGMLTFYARGLGARVADLSLTRGEGGQNAMTGDFEDALGLLRTQELLANDRYTGVTQMFGTEVDFGFSKTKSEAFAKWTHQRVLYDAVRAIRLYRPLVITATFIGAPTDGHGQHQVSGEIAQEAFLAAGDPTVFPELTAEGIFPWQPLKMYARVPTFAISGKGLFDYATGQYVPARFTNYVTGVTTNTAPTADIIVHEGLTDPLLNRTSANPADFLGDTNGLPFAPAADGPAVQPLSYVQFARIGLGLQKSQIGPGVRIPSPGAVFDVPYHLYGSCLPSSSSAMLCHAGPSTDFTSRPGQSEVESSAQASEAIVTSPGFFDGIDTSILGIADLDEKDFPTDSLSSINSDIWAATQHLDPAHPEAIAPILALTANALNQLIASVDQSRNGTPEQRADALHELNIKRVQLNEALTLVLGLRLTAEVPTANLPTNTSTDAQIQVTQTSDAHISFRRLMSENGGGAGIAEGTSYIQDGDGPSLAFHHPVNGSCGLDPTLSTQLTRPYFFRENIEAPVYQLSLPQLRNAPSTPPALTCHAILSYKDIVIELATVATDNGQPSAFVPPASLSLSAHAQIIPNLSQSTGMTAFVIPAITPVLEIAPGWTATPATTPTHITGQTAFQLAARPDVSRAPFTLKASVTLEEKKFIEGYRPVGYGNLPRTNYFTPATDRIVPVDLNLTTDRTGSPLRIAYLPGTGDSIPEALASIGLAPTLLKVSDLTPVKLAHYDTIILGVRTYSAHPDLHGSPTQALLDFARAGGNVVVQYQTPEFTAADAPYPLSLGSNEKVVDETAPVDLLAPPSSNPHSPADFALLTTPNRITSTDFNGWIEERGHGFLADWDPRYTALTETHDPGAPSEDVAPQLPQRGGLITTTLGKGRWTYCAFALYRQLPEAVPGAYRLFLNLLNP